MKNAKTWLAFILLALVVIFALQNLATIQVNFLGFGFETRRVILMLLCVVIGFILGKAINLKQLTRR